MGEIFVTLPTLDIIRKGKELKLPLSWELPWKYTLIWLIINDQQSIHIRYLCLFSYLL